MKDVALKFARRGFRTVPCFPGSKRPMTEGYTKGESFDEWDVIEQWPKYDCNVGVHGVGYAIIDVDVKNGRNGLAQLAELPPLPKTMTVRTPSGGLHLYFKLPEGVEVSNSARGLPSGFDVRGANGIAIAPGSIVDGKRYEFEIDMPPAPAPEWLLERLRAPRERAKADSFNGEPDTPLAIERARALILKAAPAIQGQRGDQTTYDLSCSLWNLAISADTQFELLQPWNDRCEPPWTDDELERKIENARRFNTGRIGRDHPTEGLERILPPPNDFSAQVEIWDESADADQYLERRPWLAYKRLLRGKITVLVAPGSIGKSLLTLQWAASVALGAGPVDNKSFCGLDVRERTNVLVINTEDDKAEMKMRLAAMCRHFDLPRDEIRKRVHLWSGQSAGALPFKVARKDGRYGEIQETEIVGKVIDYCRLHGIGVLIVDAFIDTHGANENDNGEMQTVMSIYRRVASELNISVVLVHHTKKPSAGVEMAGSADAGRGASAVINAARIGLTLFNMNAKEAEKYKINDNVKHRYVRLDDAKTNLFLASENAEWFHRQTVRLPNGEDTGVLVPVELSPIEAGERGAILDILAARMSDGERIPIKTAARYLTETEKFAGYTPDGLVARVFAALETGTPAAGGKQFKCERAGKTGGSMLCLIV